VSQPITPQAALKRFDCFANVMSQACHFLWTGTPSIASRNVLIQILPPCWNANANLDALIDG
jgi:hypothetical protein